MPPFLAPGWRRALVPLWPSASPRHGCRVLVVLAALVSLITSAAPAGAQHAPYLSANHPGYRLLEQMQQMYCSTGSHAVCEDDAQCLTRVRIMWRQYFGETVPDNTADDLCERVSTRYEAPGVHYLLSGLYREVASVAGPLNLGLTTEPALGSLPIRSVNAQITNPTSGGRIIVFNLRFLEFVHEMTKVAALALPIEENGDLLAFDTTEAGFRRRIRENPELRVHFARTVLTFLEEDRRPAIEPPTHIQPILVTFDRGVELFAMGHEYAHAAHGHIQEASSLELEGFAGAAIPDAAPRPAPSPDAVVGRWIDEVEADVTGARLVRALAARGETDPARHPLDPAFIAAPDFYVGARLVLEDARSILTARRPLAPPSAAEQAAGAALVACLGQPGCDPRVALQPFGDRLRGAVGDHPHPSVRREVLHSVLQPSATSSSNDFALAIANGVTRNLDRLWAMVRPAFLQTAGVSAGSPASIP